MNAMKSFVVKASTPMILATLLSCCSSDDPPAPVDPPEFDPLPLRIGVSKAKDLLSGSGQP
jgi:hypothetical protein